MSNYDYMPNATHYSMIGEGTRFKGEFNIEGLLRIDGDFLGNIRSQGKVLIGLNGRADCNIHAKTIVVGGVVRGNIIASDLVHINSTGMVLGSITAARLIVEEDVIINGTCKIVGAAQDVIVAAAQEVFRDEKTAAAANATASGGPSLPGETRLEPELKPDFKPIPDNINTYKIPNVYSAQVHWGAVKAQHGKY